MQNEVLSESELVKRHGRDSKTMITMTAVADLLYGIMSGKVEITDRAESTFGDTFTLQISFKRISEKKRTIKIN